MAFQLITFDPITVASAGTAVQLSEDDLWFTSVTIQAAFTNTGKITVGGNNVSSTNGIEIPPGDTCSIEVPDGERTAGEFLISEIWVNATSSGDKVRVCGFKRRI